MDVIDQTLNIGSTALAIVACLYAWFSARSKANASAINAIDEQLDALESRVTKVEAALSAIPELKADVGKVFDRVNAVSDTAHVIEGQMKQMNHSMSLMLGKMIGTEATKK